jgi:TatD DNase family protein
VVGQDAAENRAVLAATAGSDVLLPFLGLHPDRFGDRFPERVASAPLEALEDVLTDVQAQIRAHAGRLVGIGEVGLDYWVCQDEARRAAQRDAFAALVRLAQELELPLNVHSRSAGHHTIDLLLELGARRVLMHAFDGKAGHALRGAEAGFLFSVPPSIVRSPQKRKLVRALPLESLALETDSPVLGPEPGVRNEPANVALSAAAIAEIKGLPEAQVREVTAANARRLFGLEG